MSDEQTKQKIDDGGPAFPTDCEQQTGADTYHFAGMSTRTWLAGMATQHCGDMLMREHGEYKSSILWSADTLAKMTFEVADAQLSKDSPNA